LCVAIFIKAVSQLEIKVDDVQIPDMDLSEKGNSNSLDACTGVFISRNECDVLLHGVNLSELNPNACSPM